MGCATVHGRWGRTRARAKARAYGRSDSLPLFERRIRLLRNHLRLHTLVELDIVRVELDSRGCTLLRPERAPTALYLAGGYVLGLCCEGRLVCVCCLVDLVGCALVG